MQWFEHILNVDPSHAAIGPSVPRHKVLDYLSHAHYKMGDLKRAILFGRELLRTDPGNVRITHNVAFYEDELQLTGGRGDSDPGAIERTLAVDNYLQHTDDEMAAYRRLCRGEASTKTASGYCTLKSDNPLLKITPQYVEHVLPRTHQV